MTEFNGHPSYEHWNVSLWVGNEEFLYDMAREMSRPRFATELKLILGGETPDGVCITNELAEYAWDCMNPEDLEEPA